MMFWGKKDESDSLEEVDTAERGDAEVEEDAEDDCRRDEPQKRGKKDREPDQQTDTKAGHPLVWNGYSKGQLL